MQKRVKDKSSAIFLSPNRRPLSASLIERYKSQTKEESEEKGDQEIVAEGRNLLFKHYSKN